MSWNTIPDFGDPYSKRTEWVHEPSGANVAEVLYDAHDRNDNPVAPQDDADGHGRWLGIQINGVYETVLWKHSRKSGGKTDYGFGGRKDALADIASDISQKEKLVAKAQEIAASSDYGIENARTMGSLMDEWKKIRGWFTPREDQLWADFNSARKSFYEGRDTIREQAKIAKEALAAEAEKVLADRDFRGGSAKMRELMDRWKQTPSAGRDVDNALWERFNGARKAFFDAQHENYQERQRLSAEHAEAKRELIAKATEISEAKDFSRSAADAMRALGDEWKAVGSAGRDEDERLWQQFRAAQDPFWSGRRIENDRRRAEYEKKHAAWCVRMEGVIAGKERALERIDDEINYLEYRLTVISDPKEKAEVEGQLADEKAQLAQIQKEIDEIRSQM